MSFAWVARRAPGAAIVSPISGAPQQFIDIDDVDVVIPDGANGWYVGARDKVRHLRADGTVRPGFEVTTEQDVSDLALSPDGSTLWIAARWDVRAVRTTDGTQLPWDLPMSIESRHIALSPGGDVVYVAGTVWQPEAEESTTVAALSTATGALLGYGPQGYGTGLVVGPDAVYVGILAELGPDGVAALDPRTLAVRWRTETSIAPDGLALAHGRLFLSGP